MELTAWEWFARLALATVLAGLIGIERETHHKSVGLRTTIMVGLGAAAFTIASLEGFGGVEKARVASGIVIGVGFLGAGAIFRQGASVSGLTTAASLWLTAAIGLTSGAGEFAGAAIVTGFGLFVLWGLRAAEMMVRRRAERTAQVLEVDLNDTHALAHVLKLVDRFDQSAEVLAFDMGNAPISVLRLRIQPETIDRIESVAHSVDGVVDTRRMGS
ncbi:MgtC/SapB family protein [bacterium]|nr:MgtC/SapB family protein [bacterium]